MEVGWKQRLDNGLYFSLVYYQMDWTNLKTRQAVPITSQWRSAHPEPAVQRG